jgi:hypothetical protein
LFLFGLCWLIQRHGHPCKLSVHVSFQFFQILATLERISKNYHITLLFDLTPTGYHPLVLCLYLLDECVQ